MKKSYNDLSAQVARIVAMVDERGGYKKVQESHTRLEVTPCGLWRMRGDIWARRGGSLFCKDRNEKREWRAEMLHPLPLRTEPPAYTPALPYRKPHPAPLPPPTAEERRAIEYKLNKVCDEADIAKLLRFVAASIMIRKEFLTDLDPLEIPKRIIAEMQALLPKTPKNATPTDNGQLSLPFV